MLYLTVNNPSTLYAPLKLGLQNLQIFENHSFAIKQQSISTYFDQDLPPSTPWKNFHTSFNTFKKMIVIEVVNEDVKQGMLSWLKPAPQLVLMDILLGFVF